MTANLDELITAAIQLGGGSAISHGHRLWTMEGGRQCPLGWDDCSQPVYVDLTSGEYDYGDPGGPAWKDCRGLCPHSGVAPEEP